MPWIQALLGAASDAQKQGTERKQRAIDARFSPWINPSNLTKVQDNGALQGGMAGFATGQDQQQKSQNADAWRQWMGKDSQQPAGNTMPTQQPMMGGFNIGPYASGKQYDYAMTTGYGGTPSFSGWGG